MIAGINRIVPRIHVLKLMVSALLGLAFLLASQPLASAQNVGGVFGPEVTPGSRALEFRTAFAPPSDGRPGRITNRLHYQQSVTDNLRLRAVVQGGDTNTSGFDFDLVQFEAQYQFVEDEDAGFDSAVRLDLLINDKGSPNLVSLNWTNDVPLGGGWTARALVLAQVQFGDNRNDGLFLQTRSSLRYQVNPRYNLQVQVFNAYGSTDDFPSFRDQSHSIGPAIAFKIGQGWSVEASTLFGLTNATADADFRVFLTKSF